MATRQEGIEAKLLKYAEEIITAVDPKAKVTKQATQVIKDTAKNLSETFVTTPFFLVGGGSATFTHDLKYIPSVTLIDSLDAVTSLKIIRLTDTEITVYNGGSISGYPCYIHCH